MTPIWHHDSSRETKRGQKSRKLTVHLLGGDRLNAESPSTAIGRDEKKKKNDRDFLRATQSLSSPALPSQVCTSTWINPLYFLSDSWTLSWVETRTWSPLLWVEFAMSLQRHLFHLIHFKDSSISVYIYEPPDLFQGCRASYYVNVNVFIEIFLCQWSLILFPNFYCCRQTPQWTFYM